MNDETDFGSKLQQMLELKSKQRRMDNAINDIKKFIEYFDYDDDDQRLVLFTGAQIIRNASVFLLADALKIRSSLSRTTKIKIVLDVIEEAKNDLLGLLVENETNQDLN